ncbi:hypothetical protein D3C71_1552690 [compost metagenome]
MAATQNGPCTGVADAERRPQLGQRHAQRLTLGDPGIDCSQEAAVAPFTQRVGAAGDDQGTVTAKMPNQQGRLLRANHLAKQGQTALTGRAQPATNGEGSPTKTRHQRLRGREADDLGELARGFRQPFFQRFKVELTHYSLP